MGILFEECGMFTTVQDEGRYGYQQYGVSVAGPMDFKAFYLANILVGNEKGEGALEISFIGPKILFQKANVIAVTGADLTPMINDERIEMNKAFEVREGDVLSFGGMKNGCRGYIAFAGGLDVPLVMGSKATLVRNQIGGIDGRTIQKGDQIPFASPRTVLEKMELRQVNKETYPAKEVVVRVVLGPQDQCFSKESIRQFFWYGAKISGESDRMGYRLECEPIEHIGDGNIITDGIVFGSIQIPPDGKPIIMMADRQTTGGYTKIGTVITADLPKLAQCMPGQKLRFVEVSVETAQELYIRELEALNALEQILV